MDAIGARRGPTLRSRILEAMVGLGLAALAVLLVSATDTVDRPPITDRSWLYIAAIGWGLRSAYDHRRSEPQVVLAWGAGMTVMMLALLVGLTLFAHAIAPSVRAQSWLVPLLFGLFLAGVISILVQHVLLEATAAGRRIAIAEELALGLIPFGIWLAVRDAILITPGAALAIGGPLILYWLQGQRRRRGLTTARRAQP